MDSEMGYVVALFGRVAFNALYAVWWSVSVVHTIGPHPNYYNLSNGCIALRDDTRENNLLKIRTRVRNI